MGIMTCAAEIAQIGTAVAAASWTGWVLIDSYCKRIKVEEYLRKQRDEKTDLGRRTMIHLMSKLSLTEDEIFHAAFRSKHIECPVIVDKETNRASDLYFVYKD